LPGISGKADSAKYYFSPMSYLELKADRLATFFWGAAMAAGPLILNFIVAFVIAYIQTTSLDEYFKQNISDATFTGFAIAAVAVANTCFNSFRPTQFKKIRLWTHLALGAIILLTVTNIIVHVICSATHYEKAHVYFFSIAVTFSVFLISWLLQISYVKDATYRA
jgi:hypothetical protein